MRHTMRQLERRLSACLSMHEAYSFFGQDNMMRDMYGIIGRLARGCLHVNTAFRARLSTWNPAFSIPFSSHLS